jgi:tRNA threonylcarbamoyladenosine biosynthesis protein TsaB
MIFQHIQQLLERTGLRLEDVEGFAAATGPGSFTGVRVGLACVKGLAEAMGKPAVAVSNLAALARFGSAELRVPIIDARRGEVYAAVYDDRGSVVMPEAVCPYARLLERLPHRPLEFVTQGYGPIEGYPVATAPKAIAAMVARMAEERLDAGEPGDPAGLDANYVRRSDAELLFKPW